MLPDWIKVLPLQKNTIVGGSLPGFFSIAVVTSSDRGQCLCGFSFNFRGFSTAKSTQLLSLLRLELCMVDFLHVQFTDSMPYWCPKRVEYKEATLGFGWRHLLIFELFLGLHRKRLGEEGVLDSVYGSHLTCRNLDTFHSACDKLL